MKGLAKTSKIQEDSNSDTDEDTYTTKLKLDENEILLYIKDLDEQRTTYSNVRTRSIVEQRRPTKSNRRTLRDRQT